MVAWMKKCCCWMETFHCKIKFFFSEWKNLSPEWKNCMLNGKIEILNERIAYWMEKLKSWMEKFCCWILLHLDNHRNLHGMEHGNIYPNRETWLGLVHPIFVSRSDIFLCFCSPSGQVQPSSKKLLLLFWLVDKISG